MTKPVTIPNTFATATTAIPLSQLDSDFSTVATALNDANTYSNYAADTGVANAYVVTLSGVSTTYSAGLRIQFKAGAANTGASTLNVNGGGTKNITFQDASALSSGTIAANAIVDVMYDGTQFLLMNDPAGATGGDVVGPSSATDNAIVRFDGATGKLVQNSVVTIADSTGDMSGVGQLNATTVDATNIEVTNIKAKDGTAAASIADSTGVISITSNPVLSGGTANGVLYLNGSKVATSGSALTFDGSTFAVNSAASIGSSTAKTKFYSDSTYNGIFNGASLGANEAIYMGAGTQFFFAAGSEQMRLTSTGLGIGTSTPAYKLDLTGSNDGYGRQWISTVGYPSSADNSAGFQIRNLGAGVGGIRFADFANSVEWMRLDSSGNLGIGTSSPAYRLSVVGPSGDNILSEFRTGDATAANNAGGGFRGTSSATAASRLAQIWLDADGANLSGGDYFIINKYGNSGNVELNQFSNAAMLFLTNNTERARITSGGDLLVGTTSGSFRFVAVSSASDYISRLQNTASSTPQGLSIYYSGASPNGTGSPFLFCEDQSVLRMSVRSNGGIANYQSNNVDLSDARTKKEITPAPSYWDKIGALEIVTYKYNDQTHDDVNVGVIAQQVEQVEPVWVDADGFGETPEDGVPLKTVYTKDITFAAIKALQEAMARIETLEAKVSALEGN